MCIFDCVCSGSPKTLTVDGADAQTVLPNLIPGVTYQVTVIAVKGQKESQPASDSVTTGETASPTPTHNTHLPYYLILCLMTVTMSLVSNHSTFTMLVIEADCSQV